MGSWRTAPTRVIPSVVVAAQDHRVGIGRIEERRPAAMDLNFSVLRKQLGSRTPGTCRRRGLGIGVLTG